MAAQCEYPLELRERATRLAVEARRDPAERGGRGLAAGILRTPCVQAH